MTNETRSATDNENNKAILDAYQAQEMADAYSNYCDVIEKTRASIVAAKETAFAAFESLCKVQTSKPNFEKWKEETKNHIERLFEKVIFEAHFAANISEEKARKIYAHGRQPTDFDRVTKSRSATPNKKEEK